MIAYVEFDIAIETKTYEEVKLNFPPFFISPLEEEIEFKIKD